MTDTPATFNHPHWMRAILAQLADSGGTAATRAAAAAGLVQRRFPITFCESLLTPLTPGGLPMAVGADGLARLVRDLGQPLVLRGVPKEQMAAHHLGQDLQVVPLRRWQRAVINTTGSFDDWLMQNFDHKRRKELKRLRSRLSEQGDLQCHSLEPRGDLAPFVAAFLALEAQSWKGARGTAIRNSTQLENALREGLQAMHAQGKVHFWTLALDGRPIAALFALVDGGEATLGKIAHATDMAKYSPGVQVILQATEQFFADPAIALADSNAIPDHPMINRIWRDRRIVSDYVVAQAGAGGFAVSVLTRFLGTKDAARGLAKRAVQRATGRRMT